MAARAPAHRCFVVFIAPVPPTLTSSCFSPSSTTTLPPWNLAASSEPLSPFRTKHPVDSCANPSLLKLTDKNPPPNASGTLLSRRQPPKTTCFRRWTEEQSNELETPVEELLKEIKCTNEEGMVGSRNNPPLANKTESGSETRIWDCSCEIQPRNQTSRPGIMKCNGWIKESEERDNRGLQILDY